MAGFNDKSILVRSLGGSRALIAAVVVAGIGGAVFVLSGKDSPMANDPIVIAEAARSSLLDQLGVALAPADDPEPVHSAPSDTVASAGAAANSIRDLFVPVRRAAVKKPPAESRPQRPQPPKLPQLSAILIDGTSHQAWLGGRLVRPGGWIDGFKVLQITAEVVVLGKGGKRYELRLGDKK